MESLLSSLCSLGAGVRFDEKLQFDVLSDFKECVEGIIKTALIDIERKKDVRMCTALIFDDKKVEEEEEGERWRRMRTKKKKRKRRMRKRQN